MLASVLLAATTLLAVPETAHAEVATTPIAAVAPAEHAAQAPPADPPPPPTINEFIPEERALGDCISALPKPGCGSEARGGWRQSLILVAIVGGLAFIVWRVVRSARRAREQAAADAPAG